MFTAIGRFLTSVVLGISSLLGIHHLQSSQPTSMSHMTASSTKPISASAVATSSNQNKTSSPVQSSNTKIHTTASVTVSASSAILPGSTETSQVAPASSAQSMPQPDGNAVCKAMNAVWDGTQANDGSYNCSCKTGYVASADGRSCVVKKSGYQVCSEAYPNETWDGTYGSNGNYNCVCKTGYGWDQSSQSCISNVKLQAQGECSSQIQQLYQEISALRSQLAAKQAGDLTTGTAAIAQGNATRDAQLEAQQEQPIWAQIQSLQSSCN